MIAFLRQSATNLYTLNTLTAILDACAVAWRIADSAPALALGLAEARRRGETALAFYSFMTPHLGRVKEEIQELRRSGPSARLLAGGPHATADPLGSLALGFDHVFVGDAERTLPAFLRGDLECEAVLRDPAGGPGGLDDFSPFGAGRVGPVELTRGCRYACGFCAVGRRKVRHRSVESVLAAAERLLAAGRRKIAFVTPDALSYGNGLRDLERLLSELRSLGMRPVLGSFPSEVRPDRVTRDAVELLARGCDNRTLVIGAQSGSDAVLRRLGRGHTVEDAVNAAGEARRGGFMPHVDFIFGLPGESAEERRASLGLADGLRRDYGAKIHAHFFHPLPGTPLWGQEPTPLDGETRRGLAALRRGGAEDGCWQEQERWAWQILEWARAGWIQAGGKPRG